MKQGEGGNAANPGHKQLRVKGNAFHAGEQLVGARADLGLVQSSSPKLT